MDSKFYKECGTQLLPLIEAPEVTKTLETPPQELTRGTTFAGRYEIVEKLGTGGMGSVRKVGNNLRITAQLIDATTDEHLWAEKYSGTLDDVFDIQENGSRSIVEALI